MGSRRPFLELKLRVNLRLRIWPSDRATLKGKEKPPNRHLQNIGALAGILSLLLAVVVGVHGWGTPAIASDPSGEEPPHKPQQTVSLPQTERHCKDAFGNPIKCPGPGNLCRPSCESERTDTLGAGSYSVPVSGSLVPASARLPNNDPMPSPTGGSTKLA